MSPVKLKTMHLLLLAYTRQSKEKVCGGGMGGGGSSDRYNPRSAPDIDSLRTLKKSWPLLLFWYEKHFITYDIHQSNGIKIYYILFLDFIVSSGFLSSLFAFQVCRATPEGKIIHGRQNLVYNIANRNTLIKNGGRRENAESVQQVYLTEV